MEIIIKKTYESLPNVVCVGIEEMFREFFIN